MESSLYLHIPYCLRKCSYCDFTSFAEPTLTPQRYVELLCAELQLRGESLPPVSVPTVYFGGGTPSLLPPPLIARLLTEIDSRFTLAEGAEITLEANPGTVSRESLQGYRAAGVNRLSLGVQALDDPTLALLGRIHSAAAARQAFAAARAAGYTNVSIDLMHSLPGQTLAAWQTTLREAVALGPEHISVYGLTLESGTPLARQAERGELQLPDEELAAAMFELTSDYLCASGFQQYEIANFARPGCASRHNQVYWQRGSYLGLGAGAHSFLAAPDYGRRWENPATLEDYAAAVTGRALAAGDAPLTRGEAMGEFMFLGLRLLAGVNRRQFAARFGQELEEAFPAVVARLSSRGLLAADGDTLRLTKAGLLLANLVMAEFV